MKLSYALQEAFLCAQRELILAEKRAVEIGEPEDVITRIRGAIAMVQTALGDKTKPRVSTPKYWALTKHLLWLLDKNKIPRAAALLLGSAALAEAGIRDVDDLDVFIPPDIIIGADAGALIAKHETPYGVIDLCAQLHGAVTTAYPHGINDLFYYAQELPNKLQILTLRQVERIKIEAAAIHGRDKDKTDLKLIDDYKKAGRSLW